MTNKQSSPDIDIDVGDRDKVLPLFNCISASILTDSKKQKHNTGVYFSDMPHDENKQATIDYKEAEERGYFKVDILNVHVYQQVKNEEHLIELMKEPNWSLLQDQTFVDKVIHINGHYADMTKMPEPIDSIPRLAMFLALIRPAKRYLLGKTWSEVAKEVWVKTDDGYAFKKAHSVGYAHLVVVHINLLAAGNEQ